MSTTEQKALEQEIKEWNENPYSVLRRLSAENEALRAREGGLIRALAECRDLFPMPEPGAELELIWGQAMGDPESVPGYVKAQVDALRAQVEALTDGLICKEAALIEWFDKTDWVSKTAKPSELGKHRADVLRERVEALTKPVIQYTQGEWFMASSIDEMQAFFESRLPAIRATAYANGYAIGVHGSMRRDLDLIAAPWREGAADAETLAHAIARAACGIDRDGAYNWEQKPFGRIATSLPICWVDNGVDGAGHIDLSVVPQPLTRPAVPDCKCTACGAPLKKVVQSANSYLSAEQFDADKLGDWFCESCPEGPNKGSSKHRYFWQHELPTSPTQASKDDK